VTDACQVGGPGLGATPAEDRVDVHYGSKAEAVAALSEWERVHSGRDDRIMAAIAAGVGVNEIARVTGMAKTTVLRVRDQREYEARCERLAALTSSPGSASRLAAYVRAHYPDAAEAAGRQSLLVEGTVDWLSRVADHDSDVIEAAMTAIEDDPAAT
jgi:hypothetical protein